MSKEISILLSKPALLIEVEEIPGTISFLLADRRGARQESEMDKGAHDAGTPLDTALDFTEVLTDLKHQGQTDLQLKIGLQANESGGSYGFLLRYPGGQHPETGRLRPGQNKAWAFRLLL